jgi:hypothetical protein
MERSVQSLGRMDCAPYFRNILSNAEVTSKPLNCEAAVKLHM